MRKVSIITLSLVMLINSGVVFSAPRKASKKRFVKVTAKKVPTITSEATVVNEPEEQNSSEEIAIQLEASENQKAIDELKAIEELKAIAELKAIEEKEKDKKNEEIKKLLSSLQLNIDKAKSSCSGIKDDLKGIQVLAGISTGASAVGTLTSGGALATGIIKNVKDKKIEENKQQYDEIEKLLKMSDAEFEQAILNGEVLNVLDEFFSNATKENLNEKKTALEEKIDKDTKTSKTLGNVRTGLMAGSIATSATSTITSGISIKKLDKLMDKMKDCDSAATQVKSYVSMIEAETDESYVALTKAKDIVKSCSGFDTANIKEIKGVMTASTVVGGIGAATSIAGTITSAMANSKNVRDAEGDEAEKKEKNLNLASNIMAGISTGTSAGGIVLGAVTLSKLAKNVDIAEKCEDALK